MGLMVADLSLDCRCSSKPVVVATIGQLLREVSRENSLSTKTFMISDYVQRLDDELKKIDAFKRELPISMLLLTDAQTILKDELGNYEKLRAKPVLEEFIPLKTSSHGEQIEEKDSCIKEDKMKNWMSSVESRKFNNNHEQFLTIEKSDNNHMKEGQNNGPVTADLLQRGEKKSVKTAFVPFFRGGSSFIPMVALGKVRDELPVPGLTLCTPQSKNSRKEISPIAFRPKSGSNRSGASAAIHVQPDFKVEQQHSSRKQRRCWSNELHRLFVSALSQLGGPKVATPKQIRELMQVDGLTNDEVKSHLQKYRLHSRRVSKEATRRAGSSTVKEQRAESLKRISSQVLSPESLLQSAGFSPGNSGGHSLEEEDEHTESHHEIHVI